MCVGIFLLVYMCFLREMLGAQCCLFTGKVVFEGCKQVPDDRHTPGPAQQLLPCTAAHVGHVSVVDGESKDPKGGNITKSSNTTQGT